MTPHPHHFWTNVAAVAYKETSVIRHDRALLATVVMQPLTMLILLGFALSNKPANVPWAVLDQNRSGRLSFGPGQGIHQSLLNVGQGFREVKRCALLPAGSTSRYALQNFDTASKCRARALILRDDGTRL